MKYLLHASIVLFSATSIQYSHANTNRDATLKKIETLCADWHTDPVNTALIQKIFKSETDFSESINPSDLDTLLELVAKVELLEKELIKSDFSSVEARLESFVIFSTALCNHISDDQRTSLKKLLETDNQELDTQLETATTLLLASNTTDNQIDLQAQPEAQYFLFMYSLRKQLMTN